MRTRSARLVKALAELYHVLPSEVLRRTPEELYVDILVTFPPDGEATAPRKREADDPTLVNLLAQLKAGRANGAN